MCLKDRIKSNEEIDILGLGDTEEPKPETAPKQTTEEPAKTNGVIDIFGSEVKANPTNNQPSNNNPVENKGGDLLDMDIFDSGPSSQQNNVAVPKNLNDLDILGDNNQNNMANTDLLGSPLQQQNNIIFNNNANVNSSNNNDLLGGVMDLQVQAEPPKKSVLNDLESAQFGGLDLLGTNQTVSNSSQGKFSMSAYSDNAIEILFDCQMVCLFV